MTEIEAIRARHAVRAYSEKPIETEKIAELQTRIAECNAESGLHIQLVTNEPKAFTGTMAHYGKFSGVQNYLALVGKKGADEAVGYYGEKIVLRAQTLGLNTCWVALTFSKVPNAFTVEKGEKLHIVIPLGYGETQGVAHKSKPFGKVAAVAKNAGAEGEIPAWFTAGVEAALLAPTAMNQQKFSFTLGEDKKTVRAKAGMGLLTKLDLGIAKYHFEIGAGKDNFRWA